MAQEPLYDLPPESFCVSTADEQEWYDRNAVMQRKASLKFAFNRNSFSNRSDAVSTRRPSARARKSFGIDGNHLPANLLFRSRSEPGGKPPPPNHLSEPTSPRVSCIGRVGVKNAAAGTTKKAGFSRLLGSLFRTGSGKNRPRKRCVR